MPARKRMEAPTGTHKERLRHVAQMLVAEIGAPGPEYTEETAARAVAEVRRLRDVLRKEGHGYAMVHGRPFKETP